MVAAFVVLVALLAFAWLPWMYLRDSEQLNQKLTEDNLALLAIIDSMPPLASPVPKQICIKRWKNGKCREWVKC